MVSKRIVYATSLLVLLLPTYMVHIKAGVNLLDLFLVALLVFLGWECRKQAWHWPIFTLPALGILLATFISIFLAADKSAALSIFKSWFFLPTLLAFLLAQFEWKEEDRHLLGVSIITTGVIAALYAFVIYVSPHSWVDYQGVKRAVGFFNQPNYLAMYETLPILLSLGYALRLARGRWIYSLAFLICSIALLLSYSRGGILAVGFALLAGSYLLYSWRGLVLTTLSAVLIFLLLYTGLPSFRTRFSSVFDTTDQTTSRVRVEIDHASFGMLRDHPLTGIGLGNYQTAYATYKVPNALESQVPHPHDLYLAFWTESGLLGLISFLGVLGLITFRKPWEVSLTTFLFFLGLVATLVFGFFDTPYWKNDLAVFFWLCIPFLLPRTMKKS